MLSIDDRAARLLRTTATKSPEPLIGIVPADVMAWLYEHAKGLREELLQDKCPEIILSIDRDRKTRLGHYKIGRDGMGLRWRISLNLLHLARPRGDVLRTLLHEMLHAWQHLHGRPPKNAKTHNEEFREMCKHLGIPTDDHGHDLGTEPDGRFHQYLEKHGVEDTVGLISRKEAGKPRGSTLRKWSCPCGVNVRVGVADFDATCNKCGQHFELQE